MFPLARPDGWSLRIWGVAIVGWVGLVVIAMLLRRRRRPPRETMEQQRPALPETRSTSRPAA